MPPPSVRYSTVKPRDVDDSRGYRRRQKQRWFRTGPSGAGSLVATLHLRVLVPGVYNGMAFETGIVPLTLLVINTPTIVMGPATIVTSIVTLVLGLSGFPIVSSGAIASIRVRRIVPLYELLIVGIQDGLEDTQN